MDLFQFLFDEVAGGSNSRERGIEGLGFHDPQIFMHRFVLVSFSLCPFISLGFLLSPSHLLNVES